MCIDIILLFYVQNNNNDTSMSTDGGITPVSFIRLAAQSLHRLHRHRDDYLEIKWTLH